MMAGELKKLKIALPDCFVLASARRVKGRAVSKRVEAEMKLLLEELRRLGTVFLEERVARKT